MTIEGRRAGPVWLAVGGLLALAAAIGIGRFVYTPILPPMMADLGLTKSEAGLIASANFVGYLLGAIAGSAAVPQGSERRFLLAALAISALTTAAMAAVSSVMAMAALRFAGGLASAFVMVFASTLVLERLAAQGRANLADVHFAGVGAGIAASAVLVAALGAAGADWRQLWWGSGLLAAGGLAAVAALVPAAGARPATAAAGSRLSGAQRATLARYALAYGLFGFGYVITATFLVAIVRGDPTMRPLEPVVWILVGVTAAPSVAIWGRIGRRIGIGLAFAIACVIEAVGILACIWPGGPFGASVAALVLGATLMGITALGLMGARALAPANPRRILALMTAAFGSGQIVGPIAAGFVFDLTDSFAMPTLGAAVALLAAAAIVPREGAISTGGATVSSASPSQ
ncbi:MAG: YbfB/YjiJ family MFS transporter [Hyphomicrobiaceae bacterium]